MSYHFRILKTDEFHEIIPFVFQLNEGKVDMSTLELRFEDIKTQNYECAGVFKDEDLIGISGLWYCTRHYSGKSVELDHVYIKPEHRGHGLGQQFMEWLQHYVNEKGCEAIELNTYVQNHPSHKFYYNQGFKILGYHFLKKI